MKVDRAWLRSHATIELHNEPEESRPAFDDEEDVKWIQQELLVGNTWAWCSVQVRVSWGDAEAVEWLGGCSYEDEAAFKSGGYYEDMVDACVEELAQGFEVLASTHGLWEHDPTYCLLCHAGVP